MTSDGHLPAQVQQSSRFVFRKETTLAASVRIHLPTSIIIVTNSRKKKKTFTKSGRNHRTMVVFFFGEGPPSTLASPSRRSVVWKLSDQLDRAIVSGGENMVLRCLMFEQSWRRKSKKVARRGPKFWTRFCAAVGPARVRSLTVEEDRQRRQRRALLSLLKRKLHRGLVEQLSISVLAYIRPDYRTIIISKLIVVVVLVVV